ncbi:MAG: SIS domain-containing protein [Acidobacteriaceae bacterium]|nr:SIS domain-containing protein [Acidobacteriaceae bacterium]
MARTQSEVKPALLENILSQPRSLQQVAEYQLGAGQDALLRCAETLRSSRRVVLSGMGASLFSCIPLSYMLAERGVHALAVDTSELLYFLEPMLDRDTTVVLASRSGESVEVTKLLPILKQRGCRTIGVFNVPGNTLAQHTHEQLLVNSPPDELVAIQTYTGTLAALALLGMACLGELDRAERDVRRTIASVERALTEFSSSDDAWREFSAGSEPVYFLGRGPSLASVNAGVLLMHEVAKMPAVGMSVPQFRHGPVEAVGKNFRAVVFGTQPATEKLDLALAQDLTRMGAQVQWIGRRADEKTPTRFAPVLEMIPVQMLAYRLAESRGIAMGKFRYAPMITLSEAGFANEATGK